MSDCPKFAPWLEPYADSELGAEHLAEMEVHLDRCTDCQARLNFHTAVCVSMRRVVRESAVPSTDLQARISALVAASCEPVVPAPISSTKARSLRDAKAVAKRTGLPVGSLTWRAIAPISAAAAAALILGALREADAPQRFPSTGSARASVVGGSDVMISGTAGVNALLDEFTRFHSHPDQPTFVEPSQAIHLGNEVGIPVSVPELSPVGARWLGGGPVNLHHSNLRAATLQYTAGSHRITVFVYDSHRVPLRILLEPRVARNRPVFVGSHRGYSVAALENNGRGYAVTTDLSATESAELVASLDH